MDLRFGTAMSHRTQQFGIDSCQPCQRPGIEFIPDLTHLSEILYLRAYELAGVSRQARQWFTSHSSDGSGG